MWTHHIWIVWSIIRGMMQIVCINSSEIYFKLLNQHIGETRRSLIFTSGSIDISITVSLLFAKWRQSNGRTGLFNIRKGVIGIPSTYVDIKDYHLIVHSIRKHYTYLYLFLYRSNYDIIAACYLTWFYGTICIKTPPSSTFGWNVEDNTFSCTVWQQPIDGYVCCCSRLENLANLSVWQYSCNTSTTGTMFGLH